jgi:hypothetical protein
VPVINFAKTANPGGGGLMLDDVPLPAESEGLPTDDFVLVGRAKVQIPRANSWTIGVHSDEGFALRFIGVPFSAVYGAGVRDDVFPEFMMNPVNTTDSNTRGVLTDLPAGTYEIEFISWERVGSAYYEIYAAEGAFEDDTLTSEWQLIGSPFGLQIVAGGNLVARSIVKQGGNVTIEFDSPQPAGTHAVVASSDLQNWQPVTGATFTVLSASRMRCSITGLQKLFVFIGSNLGSEEQNCEANIRSEFDGLNAAKGSGKLHALVAKRKSTQKAPINRLLEIMARLRARTVARGIGNKIITRCGGTPWKRYMNC